MDNKISESPESLKLTCIKFLIAKFISNNQDYKFKIILEISKLVNCYEITLSQLFLTSYVLRIDVWDIITTQDDNKTKTPRIPKKYRELYNQIWDVLPTIDVNSLLNLHRWMFNAMSETEKQYYAHTHSFADMIFRERRMILRELAVEDLRQLLHTIDQRLERLQQLGM